MVLQSDKGIATARFFFAQRKLFDAHHSGPWGINTLR